MILKNKITKEHLIGAAVGIGTVAVGLYLYKKNQSKVDNFLRSQGLNIKPTSNLNLDNLDLEGLTEMKEHIEDLIAEKNIATESEILIAEK